MDKLIVKGLTTIEGMKFHEIEGGFGKDKKAMLVKDIAEIHGRDLGKVNELINNNRKRFSDGVDIIDLKANPSKGLGYESTGYTKQSFNQSKNIYLLSERGYSKLLKILEDDVAWEQYEKLVDGYFSMREETKQSKKLSALEQLQLQNEAILEVNEKVDAVDTKVDAVNEKMNTIENNMPLFTVECKELQSLVKSIGTKSLGGYKTPAYEDKSLRGKVYADIQHQLKREFGVTRYEAIKHSQFEQAKYLVQYYEPPLILKEKVILANNQLAMEG